MKPDLKNAGPHVQPKRKKARRRPSTLQQGIARAPHPTPAGRATIGEIEPAKQKIWERAHQAT